MVELWILLIFSSVLVFQQVKKLLQVLEILVIFLVLLLCYNFRGHYKKLIQDNFKFYIAYTLKN